MGLGFRGGRWHGVHKAADFHQSVVELVCWILLFAGVATRALAEV